MTDRVHSITVVLDRNYREDDLEPLLTALRQMRGIIDVELNVADIASSVATSRARISVIEELNKVVHAMRFKDLGS